MIDPNVIPPMTHPYGRYWCQPPTDAILVDDIHALMSDDTFDRLANYSCSSPSGVYEGKMWKSQSEGWWLCWYGFSTISGHVSINHRKIIIVED